MNFGHKQAETLPVLIQVCAFEHSDKMADESNLGFDIAKMVEDLSVDDGGSDPEGKSEAVAKVMVKLMPSVKIPPQNKLFNESTADQGFGVEDFLNIEGMASTLAHQFAHKNKSDNVQIGVYVLTKMVILKTAERFFDIGGGLAKFDLMSLKLAQLKAKVEEINKKLDIILDAPLAQAIEFLDMALIHLEAGNIANTVEELKNVKCLP